MRVEHVREYLDLAQTLNFTRTAENFFITQPVLSRHIALLEEELGSPLFYRTRKSVELTEFGEALLSNAKAFVNAHSSLENAARLYLNNEVKAFSVGFLAGAAGPLMPRVQKAFADERPDVDVTFYTYEFAPIIDALEKDQIDVAICGKTKELVSSKYITRTVFEDHVYLVVQEGHRLYGRKEVFLSDLIGENVAVSVGGITRAAGHGNLHSQLIESGVILHEVVRDVNTLPIYMLANDWLGLTFGHLAPFYPADIDFIPIRGIDHELDFVVAWKRGNNSGVMERFAEIAAQVIGGRTPSR